ncbi:MAG: hypothetical protein KY476_20315 [Planctomycetes bacterium]|nr:hypothetical protein [Planctomycetota bacterium]
MTEDEFHRPSLSVHVVYDDHPDLIEIETRVGVGHWSEVASAYTSPDLLRDQAHRLLAWSRHPQGEVVVEAGANTGIGWIVLRFGTIDMAGHVVCHVELATGARNPHSRPEVPWRLSIEFPTEPALIERFARHLAALAESLTGVAVLEGVPR